MNKKKYKVVTVWSIHKFNKVTTVGKSTDCETGYMTVMKKGRKKERILHKTLGKALNHLDI